MYQFKTQEIDLNKEEREKAEFIIKTVKERNVEHVSGKSSWGMLEERAFNNFKEEFYRDIRFRLHCPIFPLESLGLTDDGSKLIIITVEKVS